jgi:hypothetical protein
VAEDLPAFLGRFEEAYDSARPDQAAPGDRCCGGPSSVSLDSSIPRWQRSRRANLHPRRPIPPERNIKAPSRRRVPRGRP